MTGTPVASARSPWGARLLAVLVVAAVGAACTPQRAGPSAQSAGPPPASIKVGAVVPLTGRYAPLGEQVKNGYELAVDAINREGGVMVRDFNTRIPLELKLLDDESDPTKTAQRLETHASDQVVAYLGGAGSDLHAAAAAIAEKNKTPYLGIAFALYQIHQKGYRYLFSPFPKSPGIAKMTFDIMASLDPKPTRVAIFAEKTDWGAEMRDLWKKEAQAQQFTIVADEEYAPGAQDFAPMILAARAANAEAVLALPGPPDGMAIFKQMKELDFNARFYYFIRAPDGLVWGQNLGHDGDFVVHTPGWSPFLKFPGVEQLNQAHQTRYNKPAEALTGAAYSVIQVLADAIDRAGRLDREAVRTAIAATNMTTVAGPVRFNEDGTGQVLVSANQWQGGKQILVWPPEHAAAAVAYPAPAWRDR